MSQDQDARDRLERVRMAKRLLDREQTSVPLQFLARLALAAGILLAILVGSMLHDAVRTVA